MCEKCQDRGFTEQEHGLIRVLCDCDKAREVVERLGIPIIEETVGTNKDCPWEASYEGEEEIPLKAEIITVDPMATKALTETFESVGEIDDSDSGTERDNQPAGKPTHLIIPEALPDKTKEETVDIARKLIKVSEDDISSGTGLPDTAAGSPDTSKPKQQKKPRAKKKTRARAG